MPRRSTADHLNAPRTVKNTSGAVVWRWASDAFGNGLADSNPSGLFQFEFNLRFPGQQADAETGLYYNNARYYDPATAAIVDTTGTVIARKFFTCGRHNDRRDALAQEVADRQARSGGLLKGERHAVALHRRIQGLSLDAARRLSGDIAAFAAQHGARAFVVEDLKGWRPKGPSRAQRKRFHRFQHRALVKALAYKAQELGARWLEVFARGTSRWAYDGSGVVVRDRRNAQLATFSSGKRYNADLNGALNIAARGLALLLGLKAPATDKQAAAGKSSGAVARMPLVLAHVWAHAQASRGPSNLAA